MRSPQCQMDQNNLSRVFGPTIVGHGMPEPSPSTILRDTNTQLKVSLSNYPDWKAGGDNRVEFWIMVGFSHDKVQTEPVTASI